MVMYLHRKVPQNLRQATDVSLADLGREGRNGTSVCYLQIMPSRESGVRSSLSPTEILM